jgi:hypothetical protein
VLGEPKVREKASPALRIAVEMRAAIGCNKKYDLLDRAQSNGDRRTLVQLRPLVSQKGCGFLGLGDCWSCMRRGTKLSDAVKAITERDKDGG